MENKKPFTISVLLFLPQIIVFEIGNIMFIVSLNELIYTQSPVMLKAVIIWLFDGVYFLVVYGEYANQISNGVSFKICINTPIFEVQYLV